MVHRRTDLDPGREAVEHDPADYDGLGSLLDETDAATPVLYSTQQGWWNGTYQQPLFGVRRDGWVLHWAPEGADWGAPPSKDNGQVRLYREQDDRETGELSAREPEVTRELLEWLQARLANLSMRNPAADMGAGPATLELLRDIGYLGD